jgi:hypoxanthine phosphoribosyltransferase
MSDLIPVLNKEQIDKIVADVAERISSDYQGRELILIGVLKGAFIFLSDLARYLTIPVKIDFVGLSSYGAGISPSESIQLTKEVEIDLRDKDVLVVEDIVDTGFSLIYLTKYLKRFGPKTVKICSLLDKRERRKADIAIDYVGHVIEEGFLVGYGLDHAERLRNLPGVYRLKI